MEMRDWELLASPEQFHEGARDWFISFYKERGLNQQKLENLFDMPFSYDKFYESIKKYLELYPDRESLQFAERFWDNSQDALNEYYRVRSHPLFELHSKIHGAINWLTSWKNCISFRVYDSAKEEKALFHKRYYLNIYKERYEENRGWRSLLDLKFEIVIPSKLGLGASLEVGGEDQFQLGVWAWKLGACWLTISQLLPSNWLPQNERETGISLYEDHLSFYFWWDDYGWDSRFRGINKGVFLMDLIFGSTNYERSPSTQKKIEIYLPEATYQGTAESYTATWTRPRAWWWKKQINRIELDFPDGVPVPGKGENSYDLDEDAFYGSTMSAATIEEAAQEFIQDILKTRRRYGGTEWVPERRTEA